MSNINSKHILNSEQLAIWRTYKNSHGLKYSYKQLPTWQQNEVNDGFFRIDTGMMSLASQSQHYKTVEAGFDTFMICSSVTDTDSALPTPRDDCHAFVWNGKIWLIGGKEGATPKTDVWSSPDGVNWTQTASAGISGGIYGGGAHVLNDTIYVFGGIGTGPAFNNKAYSSTDGINWTLLGDMTGVTNNYDFTSTVYQGKIWIVGGSNAVNTYKKVWTSTNGRVWTEVGTDAGPVNDPTYGKGTDLGQLLVYQDKLWYIGGRNENNDPLSTVYSSTDGITWTQHDSMPGTRSFFGAVVYNNRIWALGGYTGNGTVMKDTIYVSDTTGNKWKEVPLTYPQNRVGVEPVVFNNQIYSLGGQIAGAVQLDNLTKIRSFLAEV